MPEIKKLSGKIVSLKVNADESKLRPVEVLPEAAPAERVKPVLKVREEKLQGYTYKIKPPGSASAYITINDDVDGNPFEIFINSKDTTHFQWTTAITRVISAVMRKEDKEDIKFLVDELKSVVDPNGGYWSKGKYIKSIVSEIGITLEEHLRDTEKKEVIYPPNAVMCHVCGEKSLIKSDGCEECVNGECDYSKCS